MQYLGGKAGVAKKLLKFIHRVPGQTWVEPFMGGCNMLDKVENPRIGGDAHNYLVDLWKAAIEGYQPPVEISEDLYKAVKKHPGYFDNELVGFIGFGCSFGGKWFGGYARGDIKRNYAKGSSNAVVRQGGLLKGAVLHHCKYDKLPVPPKSLIYCDPPYNKTTGYSVGGFNSEKFYQWARDQADKGHSVYVSEYNAPNDFILLTEVKKGRGIAKAGHVEKLYFVPDYKTRDLLSNPLYKQYFRISK